MPAEQEKAYIKKEIEAITRICGSPPKGWYYGRLSSRSHALVWDVYKEMGIPLLWDSDSYADDLPYWVDVPAERNEKKPEGMLMIPYSYGWWHSSDPDLSTDKTQTAMTISSTYQLALVHPQISSITSRVHSIRSTKRDVMAHQK
jgi:peptidoglycan/xylan/chitin deacetylase (PgdA/CDA1 family)